MDSSSLLHEDPKDEKTPHVDQSALVTRPSVPAEGTAVSPRFIPSVGEVIIIIMMIIKKNLAGLNPPQKEAVGLTHTGTHCLTHT